MAWTVPMVHALLLRTPTPAASTPLKVVVTARPARSPSPRAASAETTSGYKHG